MNMKKFGLLFTLLLFFLFFNCKSYCDFSGAVGTYSKDNHGNIGYGDNIIAQVVDQTKTVGELIEGAATSLQNQAIEQIEQGNLGASWIPEGADAETAMALATAVLSNLSDYDAGNVNGQLYSPASGVGNVEFDLQNPIVQDALNGIFTLNEKNADTQALEGQTVYTLDIVDESQLYATDIDEFSAEQLRHVINDLYLLSYSMDVEGINDWLAENLPGLKVSEHTIYADGKDLKYDNQGLHSILGVGKGLHKGIANGLFSDSLTNTAILDTARTRYLNGEISREEYLKLMNTVMSRNFLIARKPGVPPQEPKIGSSVSYSTIPYTHLEPERHGKIYNSGDPHYEVTKAIPVDENLNYSVYNTDDVLYDINTRKITLKAWAYDLTLLTNAAYSWQVDVTDYNNPYYEKDESGDYVLDKDGEKIITGYGTKKEYRSTSRSAQDFDYDAQPATKVFYDVPKSDIWTLYSAVVKAELGGYKLTGSKSDLFASQAVGPQRLNVFHNKPSFSTIATSETYLDHAPSSSELDDLQVAADKLLENLKKSIDAAVQRAIGIVPGSKVDYTFKKLHVWTRSESDKGHNLTDPGWAHVGSVLDPNPDTIPENYPNGTYVGGGSVTYKGNGTPREKTFSIGDVNNVVIHTPVVCDPVLKIEPLLYDQLEPETIQRGDYFNDATPLKAGKQKNMQLDTIGEIKIKDAGTHINETIYPRYGGRIYNHKQGVTGRQFIWCNITDAKFPFDVYIQNVAEVPDKNSPYFGDSTYKIKKTYFLEKNTWLSQMICDWNRTHTKAEDKIDWEDVQKWVSSDSDMGGPGTIITFVLPVWVEEKMYGGIETRTIAINCPMAYNKEFTEAQYTEWNNWMEDESHWRTNANMIDENTIDANLYVAKNNSLIVSVFGKIYDLQVNNSRDVDWVNKLWITKKFSTDANSPRDYVTANEAPLGQAEQNRNVAYKYAPKLGYTFSFNFKTKGRKSSQINVSVADEGFYFVSKSGGTPEKVDLYYSKSVYDPNNRFIKIGSGNDKAKLTTRIADSFLKVVPQEMTDSGRIYQNEPLNKWGNKGPYHYENPVEVGSLSKLILPHSLRLTYNNILEYRGNDGGYFAYDAVKKRGGLELYGRGKDENEIYNQDAKGKDNFIGSVGRWYCGYTLPSSTVAVAPGADPNNPANIKKNGYILVRLNIKSDSVKQISGSGRDASIEFQKYLRYTGPEYLNDMKYPGVEWNTNPLVVSPENKKQTLRNNTRQMFTYYEKKDFNVYKSKNPDKALENGRKYSTIVFNKPQFEWLKEFKKNAYEYTSKIIYPSGGTTPSADMGFVAVFESDYRATQDYDLSGTH